MNEDMIKTLKESEKHRKSHPYWVWESIQEMPDILGKCLNEPVAGQIESVVKEFLHREINKVVLLGRGSSYFLTLSEKYLFAMLSRLTFKIARAAIA